MGMTREERLELLKQIEKDIYVCSLESTFLEDAKSCAIHSAIEELEQEAKTGRWIMSDDGLYTPICNNCGAHPWKGYIPTVEEATEVFKYCPNCGADMGGEE